MNTNTNTLNQVETTVEDELDMDNLPLVTKAVKATVTYDRKLRIELGKLPSKSAQIRYLHSKGHTTGDITKIMSLHWNKNVKYQHVRNILLTPVKTPRV